MTQRLRPTLADAIAVAIAPALIMTLVGSLTFFLLQVFYQGAYPARLRWIMALFILAAVLIGRISMEQGTDRAAPFSVPLALVTFLAMQRFVEYTTTPLAGFGWLLNIALIGLVWWSAHKLTWDSTLVDQTDEVSGRGLLEVLRIDSGVGRTNQPAPDMPEADVSDLDATISEVRPGSTTGWRQLITRDRRPHAHGTWVVYFSLVAIPLFGLGQWWIPVSDLAGRRYAFRLLCIYVASGLGLLLLTSFLGLRRYLRQRRLPMPATMAGAWVASGCLLIITVLALAALLPRPAAEYFVARLPQLASSPEDLGSSPLAAGQEGTSGPRPRLGESPSSERPASREPPQGETGSREGDLADRSTPESGQAQRAAESPQGEAQSRAAESEPDGRRSRQAKQPRPNRSAGAAERSGADSPTAEAPARPSDSDVQAPAESPGGERTASQSPSRPAPPSPAASQPALPAITLPLAELVKGCFQLVLALIVAWLLWRNRRAVIAAVGNAWQALRELWASWFGRRRPSEAPPNVRSDQPTIPLERPFADFADPFATGTARNVSAEELVRYTFRAFEAWAREHGLERGSDQTPHEWAYQVAQQASGLSREAMALADLVACTAYAGRRLAPGSTAPLEMLWRKMRA